MRALFQVVQKLARINLFVKAVILVSNWLSTGTILETAYQSNMLQSRKLVKSSYQAKFDTILKDVESRKTNMSVTCKNYNYLSHLYKVGHS